MEFTAVMLGLAGSLHCMLMCSPLVMAVTSGGANAFGKKVVYNVGRVLTYSILGLLFTSLGAAINLSGFHLVFTVIVALTLMVMGLAGLTSIRIPLINPLIISLTSMIKNLFSSFLAQRTLTSMFILGMLNGLLPCGMTYLALTYCLTLAGPVDGFNFMLLFGAGTMPAMLGLTSGITILLQRFNFKANLITRYGFILLGALVLGRLYFTNHEHIAHAMNTGNILFCQ